eukprot:jgi/Psemu1/39067/gm1.39067_g
MATTASNNKLEEDPATGMDEGTTPTPPAGRKFTGLDQDELKGIIVDGSKSTQYDKLYEGLKIAGGKKNSKVKTTLINLTLLTEDDFLPPMPSPADYTVLGTRGEEVIDPDKKRLLEELWIKKGERSAKRYDQNIEDLKSLFSTTEGQLSPEVKQHLKTNESWATIEDAQDTLSMLKLLREYCYRDSATKVHPMVDVANKIYRFFSCKQDANNSVATYAEEVKARFDVMTSAGISIRSEAMISLALKKAYPGATYSDYTMMDAPSKAKVNTLMNDMLLSVVIVNGCNTETHRNLSGVLKDNYSLGSDVYPTSQPKALELMNQYKSVGRTSTGQTNNSGGRGLTGSSNTNNNADKKVDSTTTTNETVLTSNGVVGGSKVSEAHQILMAGVEDSAFNDELCFVQLSTTITTSQRAPAKPRSVGTRTVSAGSGMLDHRVSRELEYMFSQSNGNIDPYWILLNSQATCNCVSNPSLLRDIRIHPEGRKVRIHCNAGVVVVDMIGELSGFGTVWYQEGGMANILSLSSVSDQYRITLDTAITQSFFVHKPDGTTHGTILAITSVEGQKKLYSDLDVRRATKARKLQDSMGFPSIKDYLEIVDNDLLLNCPVTRQDIKVAEDIFRPNTNVVKGKADVDPIPTDILMQYRSVALSIDIFTVNGIKFFRSVSRHLYFWTVRVIENSSQTTILHTLAAIIGLYATRGLVVTVVSGDNEFNCLEESLLPRDPPVRFEGVGRNQHEPYVERDNRTCKECICCMFASVPFKQLPWRVTIDMVSAAIFWLNNWCNRVRLDAAKHCKFQFGDYVLAHDDTSDNTMNPRACDAIYLRPTGDRSGAMYLFDLNTARRIRRRTATGAHMTNTVIERVEAIAAKQNAPIDIMFGDKNAQTTILDLDTESVGSDDGASDCLFAPSEAYPEEDIVSVEALDPEELNELQQDQIQYADAPDVDADSHHGEPLDVQDPHKEEPAAPCLEGSKNGGETVGM